MPKTPQKSPTFVDIFAGCGGLSYGLMAAGWDGLFAIERDANAFSSLNENLIRQEAAKKFSWPKWLPKTPHGIDEVLDSHRESLLALRNKVDLLAGGPPCQGFSSAGRRIANDPRNHLTSSYLEFVALVRPKIVLIENVKGIAIDFDDEESADGKVNYAKKIIQALSVEYNVSAEVLDTSTFGVPQKRKRFFIIGFRKDTSFLSKEMPFTVIERLRLGFLASKGLSVPVAAKSAISDLEVARNGMRQSTESAGFQEIAYKGPLTSYQRLMNVGIGKNVTDTRLARHKVEIKSRFEKIIQLCHADGRLNVSLSPELRASFGLKKCAIRVLDPDAPSPTITSMPDDLIHYRESRTLTVRENARLQSFPDSFVFKGKYTTGGDRRKKEVPRFTQVANAVPPLIAEAIGRALIVYLRPAEVTTSVSAPRKASQYSRGAAAVEV
ncbi:DNA cytosine methyltransferase [Comamonas aquatica]|uniref:Cytosine-specific methyltransferase n=1 Tax=Comamonas aquatica TaxID=225991 RepID=A0AA35D6F8_9BURK|nr:DNA cytosine methyltransferase [Comamonas aquatica]CAB5681879.1 Modification methylase BspRI [Comamonas aquatica]CAC9688159.1 Modification methylase BspRI [Comamonas aquatica]